jgi:tRNA/rRNA methyltransferase/tRNA (cytidine32/uridine32-2'-O)-methyltransferase
MIPANPDYSSLNLAAAVQILAYELRVACGGGLPAEAEPDPVDLPADAASMERFYVHLEETLAAIAFLDPANPRHLMRRLRRLYSKARPTVNELNILRGILGETQKRIRK